MENSQNAPRGRTESPTVDLSAGSDRKGPKRPNGALGAAQTTPRGRRTPEIDERPDGAGQRPSTSRATPSRTSPRDNLENGMKPTTKRSAGGTVELGGVVEDADDGPGDGADGSGPIGGRDSQAVTIRRAGAGTLALPSIEQQTDRARATMAGAKAPATLRAYRAGWNDFVGFCNAISAIAGDTVTLPVSPALVVLYLNHLAHDRRVSLSTIAQRVAAIRHAHAATGETSPTGDPAVTETVKGIRRQYAELRASGGDLENPAPTNRQKGELRLSALERIVDQCGDDPGGVRDAAMLAVGFFGAFRRSELAAVRVRDVAIDGPRMTVTVTRSKTDQDGAGIIKAFVRRSDAEYCPVRLLQRWLAIRGTADPGGYLFVNVSKSGTIGRRRLDGVDVARRLRTRATRAGIDISTLGGHSLRIGFVTESRRRGATAGEIMRQTGHKTERMIQHYTRTEDAFELNAVTRF